MEWWERHPARFLEEVEKMVTYTNADMRLMDGSRLPGRFGPGVYLAWEEIITSNSGMSYRILVVCQKHHPYVQPAAWIVEPEVRQHHHMLSEARLCLHGYFITPDKTYALYFRNFLCEWVHCYETGDWRTFS